VVSKPYDIIYRWIRLEKDLSSGTTSGPF